LLIGKSKSLLLIMIKSFPVPWYFWNFIFILIIHEDKKK
jgi:hypothetical protein